MAKDGIINARRELARIRLIQAYIEGGPGGGYQFTILNAQDGLFPLDWSRKPYPRYFRVPSASMLPAIYCDKWTGTDALVYDALAEMMSSTGKNNLSLRSRWFKEVSKTTLHTAEDRLRQTGFITITKDAHCRVVEILDPETSKPMPETVADQDAVEKAYYLDSKGARRLFRNEDFTSEIVEVYFRKSLPRAAEWTPGRNAHCPFHDDQTPSLYINVDTCQFICYAGCIEGNKLVTFEMRLLDTEDVQEAWRTVAKKIGVKLCPRGRGKRTHEHIYKDEEGWPCYRVLRYEDGSASYQRFVGGLQPFKMGLAGRRRILYNLPQVIDAKLVLIVEGEKKSDILADLHLPDAEGKPVAVTTTGGVDSWRIEHVKYLMGKRVVLLPDTDGPGRRYKERVEASLQRAGIEYRIVNFDGYGNDFRAFLNTHSVADLLRFMDCDWLMSAEQYESEMVPVL